MADFLQVMIWPFLACLVLTGIHAYLGLHVIERQVIFVDLALAQIAALGASVCVLFGGSFEGECAYWCSLGFALLGACVFALTRFKHQRIPQEAVIGIVYAVSASTLLLVLSRTGEGDEHIRHVFLGNVLLVKPLDVIKMLIIYAGIGWLHWKFRKPFFLISNAPSEAYEKKINVRFWDFLFYSTFGVVVTSSVRIAGVLLVFAYLVVPAAIGVLFASTVRSRLMLGWAAGVVASLFGMAVSYFFDFPTGASVVCSLGGLLALLAVIKRITMK